MTWSRTGRGLVLDPYFSARKQAWLRWHVTTAGVVTTSDTWLVHQLTSGFVTDRSPASRSLVTDLDAGGRRDRRRRPGVRGSGSWTMRA